MVGTTISHYEVLEKIGQGGMGEVCRVVEWVENGKAPDFIVATHSTDGWWTTNDPSASTQRRLFTRVLPVDRMILPTGW